MYDSKITTFPGLYIIGNAVGRIARAMGATTALDPCPTVLLRAVNIILAVMCIPLFYYLAQDLDRSRSEEQLLLMVRQRKRIWPCFESFATNLPLIFLYRLQCVLYFHSISSTPTCFTPM